jgi:hypothetical protein
MFVKKTLLFPSYILLSMKKPKKITVKFFLNKFLQAIALENGKMGYPLYTQITYERKNTQIKCSYGGYYDSYEAMKRTHEPMLAFEDKLLRKSVSYEVQKYGDEFQLRGLGRKYDTYSQSIHHIFDNYMKMRLREVLQKQATPNHFFDVLQIDRPFVKFFLLYEASQRLFDNLQNVINPILQEEIAIYTTYHNFYATELNSTNLEFPTVIDWLDGSHIRVAAEKFDTFYKGNKTNIEKALHLLQKIIDTKIALEV